MIKAPERAVIVTKVLTPADQTGNLRDVKRSSYIGKNIYKYSENSSAKDLSLLADDCSINPDLFVRHVYGPSTVMEAEPELWYPSVARIM
jgi:hypothetical protein